MPRFDASSLGGDLDYDFTKWGGKSGTVPEPSRFAAKRFFKDVQRVFKELDIAPDGDADTTSPDQIVEVMNAIDDEEMFDKLTDGVTDCLARLCGGEEKKDGESVVWTGGSPTHQELTALDYRPFMGFFGYLMSNLMNPELQASGMKNSPARLRSV